ncbi:hypothetical protein [Paenibacillus sp. KR2-11]|uniref:hypothetical protein n=1 Tax=Paenibacillus sp. KR2-11 TaxID=3385500 RepID=UPI0038FC8737
MENKIYAQVQNGIVVSISQISCDMIPLDTADDRLLGTTYKGTPPEKRTVSDFTGHVIALTVDKEEIAANGEDTATISIAVKTWDGQASDYNGKVGLNIGGTRLTLNIVNGTASHAFTASTPGILNIRTTGSAFTTQGAATIEAV